MILPKIALRNLTRQKRRSILLGSALSFSMLVLVVVNGITGGLVTSLQRNFADLVAGHIFFLQVEKDETGRQLDMIKDDHLLIEALADSGLKYSHLTRRTAAMGTVVFGGESASRQITGIEWTEDTQLASSMKLLAGSAAAMAGSEDILISIILAENIGLLPKVKMGYAEKAQLRRDIRIRWKAEGQSFDLEKTLTAEVDRLEAERKAAQAVMAPNVIGEEVLVQLSTIYGQQNVGSFRVAGIYEAQMDISAYVDRDYLNTLIDMPEGSYNLFGLVLSDFSNLEMKTVALHRLLQGKYDLVPMDKVTGRTAQTIVDELKKSEYSGSKTIVTNLNNELGSLVSILTGVQAGSFGLFLIVLAVVMVGLVNTFRIVIYERTREIGTMRAVGVQRSQVRNLFLLEALFLSVGGTIPGALLGLLVLNGLRLMRFDSITELGLFLENGRISYTLSPALFIGSFLMVIIFTLLAALVPARKAAKLQPAEALRTQF